MKIITIGILIATGIVGWRIGDQLSPDALAMALGLIFGAMAGIPALLLVLAVSREPTNNETHYHVHLSNQDQVRRLVSNGWTFRDAERQVYQR